MLNTGTDLKSFNQPDQLSCAYKNELVHKMSTSWRVPIGVEWDCRVTRLCLVTYWRMSRVILSML